VTPSPTRITHWNPIDLDKHHHLKYQNQVPLTHSRSLSSLGLKGAEDSDLHERRDPPASAWRWQHRNFKKGSAHLRKAPGPRNISFQNHVVLARVMPE